MPRTDVGQPWRLIEPIETSGATQMAIDRWMLAEYLTTGRPILRVYRWRPAALSLGYHQRDWPDHWSQLTWQGEPIDLVRRPSGGRAVLHQGDVTYAIVGPGTLGAEPGAAGPGLGQISRSVSYRNVCRFLIAGWRALGVELHFGDAGRGYIHNPNCFGTATAADLVMADGTKLIGSAQLWRRGAVLQHGSMRLAQDRELFGQVFGGSEPVPVLKVGIEQVEAALVAAAIDCYGVAIELEPLTELEWEAISQLKDSRSTIHSDQLLSDQHLS
jgi:lipoate---protein ligase